jgi:Kef-type K+ transport system membrane component KefB
MYGTFNELSLVIAIGVAICLVMRLIKQPLIIGYILTGVLVGPAVLHIVKSADTLQVFGDFGIALLLGLNPRVIKEIGKVAAFIGIGKVTLAALGGFIVAKILGFDSTTAIYIGMAMSFSSTIIILKLLSDKGEQNRLYGKISIGFLLFEDLIAALVLIGVSAVSKGGLSGSDIWSLVYKIVLLVGGILIFRALVLSRLTNLIERSQEFLFLFTIGWGLGLAALFRQAGFSFEIGSLIAGVMLAPLPYAQEAASRLKPLRDFFIVLFFISIGSHLIFSSILTTLPQAAIFSLLILVGNPIVVMTIMGLSGYTKKTSFKTALAGAQISEFSLILILLAQEQGRVNANVVSLVTLVALITIGISTYMITYSDNIYNFFEEALHLFERKKVRSERENMRHYELVLFGYQKGGSEFLKLFKNLGKSYVVVDYDPKMIDILENVGAHYLYGDVGDLELLEELNLDRSKLLVSTISDLQINLSLLKWLEKDSPHIVFICSGENGEQASELYEHGAAYVMLPHYIGSEKISAFIRKSGLKKSEFKKYREKHLAYLQSHHELFGIAE